MSQALATSGNRSIGTVAMRWSGSSLELLDQRLLPDQEVWLRLDTAEGVARAIRDMVVRGAPAIGISAAYGVVLAARSASGENWRAQIDHSIEILSQSRPTAVNLFWALERMQKKLGECASRADAIEQLGAAAIAIHENDLAANLAMADHALAHMNTDRPMSVLTHCNTGALATGGYGTALGVIRRLHETGLLVNAFADETRPWLQGSRLTAWELARDGIPVTLNADSAAAAIMASGKISWVIVGADRITANGDVANKIGTYSLAVLARYHGMGFMVVAPSSTVDMSLESGAAIPIEERDGAELRQVGNLAIAPDSVPAFNPVFDVTPADLIDVIVTEKGIVRCPGTEAMKRLFF